MDSVSNRREILHTADHEGRRHAKMNHNPPRPKQSRAKSGSLTTIRDPLSAPSMNQVEKCRRPKAIYIHTTKYITSPTLRSNSLHSIILDYQYQKTTACQPNRPVSFSICGCITGGGLLCPVGRSGYIHHRHHYHQSSIRKDNFICQKEELWSGGRYTAWRLGGKEAMGIPSLVAYLFIFCGRAHLH